MQNGKQPLVHLARSIGREKPFRDSRYAAVLAILRAAAVLRRGLAARFEATGLTMAQYNVLRILRGSPEGLPTLQIRRRMLEESAGITRLVDKLTQAGLIERSREGSDRRRVLCRITGKGLRLLDKHEDNIERAHATLINGFSDEDAAQLVARLMPIIDHRTTKEGNPTTQQE
jgi:MarR family transcriptional regulator, organic hydroperoxide resistance regulator